MLDPVYCVTVGKPAAQSVVTSNTFRQHESSYLGRERPF